ncbi:class I SAM-dependent methyltransferase [Actinophytocola sp.]|uniref:class I SAM-dependent methyltransferase n=1 Tax=Actinophytocola sp. TaxID=1872138 RepID=UPI00389A9FE9
MTGGVENPFVGADVGRILYGSADRLAVRTGALHRAKTAGRPAADVVAEIADTYRGQLDWQLVVDIGCGRGSSSQTLAVRLRPDLLVGIDASTAMLAEARRRMPDTVGTAGVSWIQGDFHRLPLQTGSCSLAVAAFCLYHSARPEQVIAEIARSLAPGGLAVLVTKSADSYHQLDDLVTTAGLDQAACTRPSLYSTAHSGNLATLAATALQVCHVEHEPHRFIFTSLRHVAEYLATSPKYQMPAVLLGRADAIAAALTAAVPDEPLETESTVTYVVARRQGSQ